MSMVEPYLEKLSLVLNHYFHLIKSETEFSAIATTTKLREKSLTAIGKSNYAILNHKKVIILLIQNKKLTYYVTFNQKSIPTKSIIEKIQKISTAG